MINIKRLFQQALFCDMDRIRMHTVNYNIADIVIFLDAAEGKGEKTTTSQQWVEYIFQIMLEKPELKLTLIWQILF
jgi:hypothetical protein